MSPNFNFYFMVNSKKFDSESKESFYPMKNFFRKMHLSWHPTQLSNLWWMSNSVCMGFGTAVRMGSLRRLKRCPTNFTWVSSQLGLSWFILMLSKGKLTWNSHNDCVGLFELSWWARSHGSAQNPCRLSLTFIIYWRVVPSLQQKAE